MREHVLAIVLVAPLLQLVSCSGEEDPKPAVAHGDGRVKIVYDDPRSLTAAPRCFTFYVAPPSRSIHPS
jgi:hypothetical protein